MRKKNNDAVKFGASSNYRSKGHGRTKMNLEPRTATLSQDNFNSAVESFLRATDVIKDSETPAWFSYNLLDPNEPTVKVTIHFTQEVKTDKTTVH